LLGKYAIRLLKDYQNQLKEGKDPVFNKEIVPEIKNQLECW